jgi:GT2 family glycosyltransferase
MSSVNHFIIDKNVLYLCEIKNIHYINMLYFYSTRSAASEYQNKVKKSCKTDVRIHEFINDGQYSLTESYNKALDMCLDGEILVLAHDDIVLPYGWDEKLINIFETTDYGIIGAAGSASMNNSGVWWENRGDLAGIVSHEKMDNGKLIKYDSFFSDDHDFVMNVCVVDGVFIALKKDRIKARFNEKITGFHFYDVSFSLENFLNGVKVGVTTAFKVHHKSVGPITQSWHNNRAIFLQEYGENLPASCTPDLSYFAVQPKVDLKPTNIGVVILTKDKIDYVKKCVSSLIEKTNPILNLDIVIGDTGSSSQSLIELREYISSVSKENVKLRIYKLPYYNFAKNNNDIVKDCFSDQELLLFCNNDIELINNALDLMVSTYQKNRKHCGTVGCRLLYPNNRVQHAGIVIYGKKAGIVGVTHFGLKSYYSGKSKLTGTFVGSTGAFLLMKKTEFEKLKGFNEQTTECFEDVVLNIESIAVLNKINYYQGDAVCYHYESLTRNEDPKQLERLQADFNNVLGPKIEKYRNALKKFILITP